MDTKDEAIAKAVHATLEYGGPTAVIRFTERPSLGFCAVFHPTEPLTLAPHVVVAEISARIERAGDTSHTTVLITEYHNAAPRKLLRDLGANGEG